MILTTKQKQQLRAQAHPLKPIILIGQHGLTSAVQLAIEEALATHELIKISIRGQDREQRRAFITEICEARQALLVQVIGNICVIYRKKPEKK